MAEKMVEKVRRIMDNPKHIRNVSVCAHIDHGKTTFSDNLLAGAGMMSEDLAGKACVLDFHEDEQERGITIDSASVSMVHSVDGEEYLINLIDTPGHVDFSGDVTRAMRAVDGAIVLIDAVEGIMPQTETVLKQAIRERVKPVLFINKVDRLIKELQLGPEGMQEKFIKVIADVNVFIKKIAEEQFKDKWAVRVDDGSVSFGSAFHNWAMSVDYMKKSGMSFKDIYDYYEKDDIKGLAHKAPLHKVVLNMVVRHHPDPVQAQVYRIPKIWHGDPESEVGKSLSACNPEGQTAFIVTKIVVDKHAGEVAAGRLFSGKLKQGMEVVTMSNGMHHRVQQVSVYNGAKREVVDEAICGNIVGIVGVKNVFSGETVSTSEMVPFEAIKHMFEPVVTKSIEAKKPSDLPKLIEVLRQVNKEDPTLHVEINEETGEQLLHGMGELHLEVIENRIKSEKGVEVSSSPPIVVFREAITKKSPGTVEGKSPNKHNKFFFTVEPLEPEVVEAIKNNDISEGRVKKKDNSVAKKLIELGYDNKLARNVKDVFKGCMLFEETRGVVHIGEVIEMVMDMFEDVMGAGPLGRDPCIAMKVSLQDVTLHEDSIHRGPGQIYPAVRSALRGEILLANPQLFEPIQTLMFEAPEEYMGDLSKLISNKRGQLLDMTQEDGHVQVKAKMPVAEMFGMSSDLRSATGGRGTSFLVDQDFERLPGELQKKYMAQIRERKGLKVGDDGSAVPA